MRVFQPTYKDRKGKRQHTDRYHVSFKDHTGAPRRVVAFTDEKASESLGRKLESLVAYRANGDDLPPELRRWLDGIDAKLREQLTEWGMLDARAAAAGKSLTEHVKDWHADILNRGKTANHAALSLARVSRIIEGCGFKRYADITHKAVNTYFAAKRASKGERKGMAARTASHYAVAFKAFCGWMVENGFASSAPVAALTIDNPEADRRYLRRALTVVELGNLIAAAEKSSEIVNKAGGKERALVYRFAAETGLRRNEIRALTVDRFDLDNAMLNPKASDVKNRKAQAMPFRPELAAMLRQHFASKIGNAKAFGIGHLTARMIRRDCEAVGIAYANAAGDVVDFHSMRYSFASNLLAAGVAVEHAQQLMRHSNARLTTEIYGRLKADRLRPALDALPTFPVQVGAA